MKGLKFLIVLGFFILFAPVVLFSVAAGVIILWSVISFILPFVIPIILIIILAAVITGILQAQKEIKQKEKFYKAVHKNRMPSQFYFYR